MAAAPKRDNLFGVCAAIGEDFGFDPFWLRLALAVAVIASPIAVLIAYASAAVLVVVSRTLFRTPKVRRGAEIHVIAPKPSAEPEPFRRAA